MHVHKFKICTYMYTCAPHTHCCGNFKARKPSFGIHIPYILRQQQQQEGEAGEEAMGLTMQAKEQKQGQERQGQKAGF